LIFFEIIKNVLYDYKLVGTGTAIRIYTKTNWFWKPHLF